MNCYDPTERAPFLHGEKIKASKKSEFSITLNEEYVDDFVEFRRGVDVLEELTENGFISEEEEDRRILLLENYLRYQTRTTLLREMSCSRICTKVVRILHLCWDYCLRWAYYTETD